MATKIVTANRKTKNTMLVFCISTLLTGCGTSYYKAGESDQVVKKNKDECSLMAKTQAEKEIRPAIYTTVDQNGFVNFHDANLSRRIGVQIRYEHDCMRKRGFSQK